MKSGSVSIFSHCQILFQNEYFVSLARQMPLNTKLLLLWKRKVSGAIISQNAYAFLLKPKKTAFRQNETCQIQVESLRSSIAFNFWKCANYPMV